MPPKRTAWTVNASRFDDLDSLSTYLALSSHSGNRSCLFWEVLLALYLLPYAFELYRQFRIQGKAEDSSSRNKHSKSCLRRQSLLNTCCI